MKKIFFILLLLFPCFAQAELLYPGRTTDIEHRATTGDHAPRWSTSNPTLQISSTGFLCHVTAQAYFSGTATVTCNYVTSIGSSNYEHQQSWTFTCADAKVSISPTTKNIQEGESFQITWSFSTATYVTPSMQFTGYDENIVSVSGNGRVTGKSAGTTDIYVKSNLGTNSTICKVRVSDTASGGTTSGTTSGTEAYYDWDSTEALKITLEKPGTLGDFISDSEKYNIKNIAISGPMNGADLRLLRDMCGLDECNSDTNGKIEILDLKDAVFVSGGPWYMRIGDNYYYTSDSQIMPWRSFAWMHSLKKIRFPKYCVKLTNGSLLQCQSLELMLIPPGVTSLDYYSLDGGWEDMSMSVLTLPSSMETFETSVYKCANLTDIYCYAVTPPSVAYPDSFLNSTNIANGTLYVPKGSAEAYWRAEGWRAFKDIQETLDIYNTLYIHVGEHGCVKFHDENVEMTYSVPYAGHQAFEVREDENIELEVSAHEGYVLTKLLLDEQELPIPDNASMISIGKITKPTTLKVEFEEIASVGVAELKYDNLVDVYNANGVLLMQGVSKESVHNLPAGLYIIRGNEWASKVAVH